MNTTDQAGHAHALSVHLAALLRRERGALAEFLLELANFDRKRLWLELGYSSLFYFLQRGLGLSGGAAHHRKTAAELLQRYPDVIEPLRDGRLCLSTVTEIAKVITPENEREVVPRFFGLSKREAMALAAELNPREGAPRRDLVTAPRALPLSRAAGPAGPAGPIAEGPTTLDALPTYGAPQPGGAPPQLALTAATAMTPAPMQACLPAAPHPSDTSVSPTLQRPPEAHHDDAAVAVLPPCPVAAHAPPRRAPDAVEPLTADLRRMHITVSRRFIEKLDAARDAMSHARAGGSTEEILEAALDLLLQRHGKRKGLVEKPREPRPAARPPRPEHIPASVRREVWKRDGGCCQWPVAGGGVCGSTQRVEFDHITPRAMGGPSTVENTRLLCRVHNQLAAARVYGDDWMGRYSRKGSARGGDVHPVRGSGRRARGRAGLGHRRRQRERPAQRAVT